MEGQKFALSLFVPLVLLLGACDFLDSDSDDDDDITTLSGTWTGATVKPEFYRETVKFPK